MKYKVLFAALTASVLLGIGANAMSGSGTADDPYLLADTDDFTAFAASVNNGTYGADTYAALASSIDFSDSAYTVVGTAAYPYTGHFDGRGYTLRGITLDAISASNLDTANSFAAVGVFGFASDAVIADLHVEDMTITVKDLSNTIRAGLLCGDYTANDTSGDAGFFRCAANGKISAVTNSTAYAGGIVGCIETKKQGAFVSVEDCIADLHAEATGRFSIYTAAIAAKACESGYLSTLTICRCVGALTEQSFSVNGKLSHENIGGIVGMLTIDSDWKEGGASLSASVPELDQCITTAFDVAEATDGAYCGDIVGYYSDSLKPVCYAEASCCRTSKYSITGTAVTAAKLAEASFWTGIGYDLTDVWEMTDNGIALRKAAEAPKEPIMLTYEDGTLAASLDTADMPRGMLVMALYDADGRLMTAKTADIAEDTLTLTLTAAIEKPAYVGFFFLDEETLSPLAECMEKTVA